MKKQLLIVGITLVLIVVGLNGCTQKEQPTNHAPVANFSFSVDSKTVTFADTSTDIDGNITSWFWNFDDGNTSIQQNPTHTYLTNGTYSTILTVTDDFGETGEITREIIIPEPAKTVYLTSWDNNSNVTLNIGDTVNLTLGNAGDGGYVWEIIQLDQYVLKLDERLNWGSSGMDGDFGYDTWLFTANNSGTTVLKLTSKQPWENGDTFSNFTAYFVVK